MKILAKDGCSYRFNCININTKNCNPLPNKRGIVNCNYYKPKVKGFFSNIFNKQEHIKFIKARIVMVLWGNLIPFFLIDFFHWNYWKYFILFTPINYIINFVLFKKVFQEK